MSDLHWGYGFHIAPMDEQLTEYGGKTSKRCELCRTKLRWGLLYRIFYGEEIRDFYLACLICDVESKKEDNGKS